MSDTTHGNRPDPVIPDGAFSYPVPRARDTRWFSFLLLDGFTLLAFSSALDPLRIANQVSGKPLYGWHVVSETGASAASSSGLSVEVHGALKDVPDKAQLFVCSGNKGVEAALDSTVADLRRRARFGTSFGTSTLVVFCKGFETRIEQLHEPRHILKAHGLRH